MSVVWRSPMNTEHQQSADVVGVAVGEDIALGGGTPHHFGERRCPFAEHARLDPVGPADRLEQVQPGPADVIADVPGDDQA